MLILIRASSETTKARFKRTPQPCHVSAPNSQSVLLSTTILVVALSLGKTVLSYRCGSGQPEQNSVFGEHLNL